MFSSKLKAQANLFNICSILLNAVEKLLNEVERFQHFIQRTFASGLVISSGPRSLRETHTRAPFWNDRMDRLYVYNKVGSLLAVFAALEVLNDEDEKPGRGKRRQWIRRRGERASTKRAPTKSFSFLIHLWAFLSRRNFFSFFLLASGYFLSLFCKIVWTSWSKSRRPDILQPRKKLFCFAIVFGSSFIRWRNVVCSFQQSVKAVLRDNNYPMSFIPKLREGVNQTTRREQLQWLCSATVSTGRFRENRSHFETTKGQRSLQSTTNHQQPFSTPKS